MIFFSTPGQGARDTEAKSQNSGDREPGKVVAEHHFRSSGGHPLTGFRNLPI
jgi:hypothetical protein